MAHILLERRDWDDEWRRRSLAAQGLPDPQGIECVPPLDVTERAEFIEIVMDLPGVAADTVSITVRDGTVVVAGDKRPARCRSSAAAFHLAERSFGRFVRAIRVAVAIDARRASVTLEAGELRIRLPRLPERRGEDLRLTIATRPPA